MRLREVQRMDQEQEKLHREKTKYVKDERLVRIEKYLNPLLPKLVIKGLYTSRKHSFVKNHILGNIDTS